MLYLFFQFQQHFLVMTSKYCILLFHLQLVLYFFDI